jgi:hypothetical protein
MEHIKFQVTLLEYFETQGTRTEEHHGPKTRPTVRKTWSKKYYAPLTNSATLKCPEYNSSSSHLMKEVQAANDMCFTSNENRDL